MRTIGFLCGAPLFNKCRKCHYPLCELHALWCMHQKSARARVVRAVSEVVQAPLTHACLRFCTHRCGDNATACTPLWPTNNNGQPLVEHLSFSQLCLVRATVAALVSQLATSHIVCLYLPLPVGKHKSQSSHSQSKESFNIITYLLYLPLQSLRIGWVRKFYISFTIMSLVWSLKLSHSYLAQVIIVRNISKSIGPQLNNHLPTNELPVSL